MLYLGVEKSDCLRLYAEICSLISYKLCKRGFRYFKSFWSWIERYQVFSSVLAIIMYVVQSEKVSSAIRKLQENVYGYVSFQEALVWREVDNVVLSLLVFVISLKLLHLIRFNKHVAVFHNIEE